MLSERNQIVKGYRKKTDTIHLKRCIQGGAMRAEPPLDQRNLWISGGFQAPTGAEPLPP